MNGKNAIILFDNKDFFIDLDILPLLWVKNSNTSSDLSNEPSMIDTSLSISKPKRISDVPSPGYYPSYRKLTPQQRWVYLKFLANPYNVHMDIGYVFILYYGLERHLIFDKYYDAFKVISKLRSVHKNRSFQSYSSSALFAAAIIHKDADILNDLSDNTDLSEFDTNTGFVIKALCHNNLTCEDLMNKAEFFHFTNRRYIKNEYASFYTALQKILINKYGECAMPLYSYISGIKNTKKELSFANISLSTRHSLIPDFSSNTDFLKNGYDMLLEAHNIVKLKNSVATYFDTVTDITNAVTEDLPMKKCPKYNNPKWNRSRREKDISSDFYLNNISDIEYYESKIYNDFIAYDRSKEISERINACEEAISAFYEFQKYCYQFDGGIIYFQDHWEYCHNSKDDCFSYVDNLNALLKKLKSKEDLENNLKKLENDLYEVLSIENPILQSKLFSYYPPNLKGHIKKILDEWESYNAIKKTKYKNSYLIELL